MNVENSLEQNVESITHSSLAQTLIESRWKKLVKSENRDFFHWHNKALELWRTIRVWKERNLLSESEQKEAIRAVYKVFKSDYAEFTRKHLYPQKYFHKRINILSSRDFTTTLNLFGERFAGMGITYTTELETPSGLEPLASHFILVKETFHNNIPRENLERELRPIKREGAVRLRQRAKRESWRAVIWTLTHEFIESMSELPSVRLWEVREALVEWFTSHSLQEHKLINQHELKLLLMSIYSSSVKKVYDVIDIVFPIVGDHVYKRLWLGDDIKAQKEFNKKMG